MTRGNERLVAREVSVVYGGERILSGFPCILLYPFF